MPAHIVHGQSIRLKHQIKCRLKTGSDGIFAASIFRHNRDFWFVEQVVSRFVEQVLECEAVQIGKKRLYRATEYACQTAGRCNQAFIVRPHAFDQLHRFEMTDDRTDIDAVGRCGKPQTAAFPAYAV